MGKTVPGGAADASDYTGGVTRATTFGGEEATARPNTWTIDAVEGKMLWRASHGWCGRTTTKFALILISQADFAHLAHIPFGAKIGIIGRRVFQTVSRNECTTGRRPLRWSGLRSPWRAAEAPPVRPRPRSLNPSRSDWPATHRAPLRRASRSSSGRLRFIRTDPTAT